MESKTPMKKFWFGKRAPEMADAWFEYYMTCSHKGVLDKKTRELISVACGVMGRCEHCVEAHARYAEKAGATKEEIAEAIMTASFMSSATQIFWMKDKYEELLGGDE